MGTETPESPLTESSDARDALPRTDFNLEAELEEMHEWVRSGSSVMNHAVWLDLEELDARIQRLLAHIPKEVKRARRVAREEQRILLDAKEEAGRLIAESRTEAEELITAAREEAERVVDASTIKQVAVAQSEEILHRAQENAREIRERAFAYGREVLDALEATLNHTRQQVDRGRQQLAPPQ